MNQVKKADYSDWLGVSASGLCIIHCALTPLLFTAKPVFFGMVDQPVHDHGPWAMLDYAFLALSLLAVWYSAQHTAHQTIKKALWAGWTIFAIGLMYEPHGTTFSSWLMYIGSFTLIIAHLTNYYHCQQACSVEQ